MIILNEQIIYSPITIYLIFMAVLSILAASAFVIAIEESEIKFLIPATLFLISILAISFNLSTTNKTRCNKPTSIRYTVEIIDNNAYKELINNYKIIKKVYDTKEIYLVEGDYPNESDN